MLHSRVSAADEVFARERNDEVGDYLLEEELRLCLEDEERFRLEQEKIIVEEKRFRLDKAKRLSYIVQLLLQNGMPLFYANSDKYATPWSEVDQDFIPINETDQHWCVAHFDILSGVVTFYDSGDMYDYEWRNCASSSRSSSSSSVSSIQLVYSALN
ncbi:phospholipase-like protein [Tanacetum coccineum]